MDDKKPGRRRRTKIILMSPWARLLLVGLAALVLTSAGFIVSALLTKEPPKQTPETAPTTPADSQAGDAQDAGQNTAVPTQPQPSEMIAALLEDGRKALAEGKSAQAVMLFRKACACVPDSIEAWQSLIAASVELGDVKLAWQSYEQALGTTTGDQTELRRGFAHFALNCARPTEALNQAELVLRAHPRDVDAHIVAADALLLLDRGGSALEHALLAVAEEPKNPDARISLGRALVAEKDPEQAIKILSEVLRDVPGSPRASLAMAKAYRMQGNEDAAREILAKVDSQLEGPVERLVELPLSTTGELPPGMVGSEEAIAALAAAERVELQLRRGKLVDAIAGYEKLAEEYPNLPSLRYRLAELNLIAGKVDVARQQAEVELKRNPGDPRGHAILARIYLNRGLFGMATEECNKALAAPAGNPARTEAMKTLAIAKNRSGAPAEAAALLLEYLQKRPKDIDAIMRLSVFQYEAGTSQVALKTIRKAQEQFPTSPLLPGQEGLLQHRLGDMPAATQALRKAIELGTSSVTVYLLLTDLLLKDQKPQEALDTARKCKELAPRNHLVADTLGWCLIQNDKLDEALPELQLALEVMPNAPRYLYHHAVLLGRQKNPAGAAEELRKALASTREFPEREEAERLLAELSGENQPPAAPTDPPHKE